MKLNESIYANLKEARQTGKRTFEVTIEETVDETFEVEANDMEEAEEIAIEKYKDGEFVLEPGEVTNKCLMVRDPENGEETNWVDF